jgi:hypothetical protein
MTQDKLEKLKTAIKDGKLVQEAGGITEAVTQSDKLGYDWRNIYVNKILVRQVYIEQAVKFGTADNPIAWEPDMPLIQNAYYTNNGRSRKPLRLWRKPTAQPRMN